ncbi:hypothetical protein Q7P35_002214 [Cladosporium inversicolor]
MSSLGNLLASCSARSGQMQELEKAIDKARCAVQLTPLDHPYRSSRLNNLSNWLTSRFKRDGDTKDLEEAIETSRHAVQSTPIDHPERAMYLHNLASGLTSRFKQSGNTKDLEEAIDKAQRALQLTPLDHRYRSGRLTNLGICLGIRYGLSSGDVRDLEEAIDKIRQAVQLTSTDHPDLAVYLNALGAWLGVRFARGGQMQDQEEMSECFLKAFYCLGAAPLERTKAAARGLNILPYLGRTREGIKLGKEVLDILPTVHTRTLDRKDQQFVLSGFSGIASNICALLLSEGRVYEAVECLEQGRAVIISQLLNDRSAMSGLASEHPELAKHYQSLVAEVNLPFDKDGDEVSGNMELMRRRKATQELEACLSDIRAIPSYNRFLLGQTVGEMQENMRGGYIIIVNISTFGSDAIMMTRGSLQAISLPDLHVTDVRRWLGIDWIVRRRSEQRQKNDRFLEYLAWLWNVCVREVLGHVTSLCDGQNPALPRVWWIGCGLASSLPFHAAGIHARGSSENALSRVISSYTPSVKALGHARSQIEQARSDQPMRNQMLITLMPTTPKGVNDNATFDDLKGVLSETRHVESIVSHHVSTVVRVAPDTKGVLKQLETCPMVHFACHGVSDPQDPSSSGLVLQQDSGHGTFEQDILSVHRISQLQLKHAQIAYLSACSTAENKETRLQDEVIHIVSGFQVAGFPHVIGSLWPAGDTECVEVACHFYSSLFAHKGSPVTEGRSVAWALHEAVMAVRAEDMDMPLDWAQFVHYGA